MESAAAAEAKALLASGRASAAVALLVPVLAQSPRWGRGWLLLGQARAREGDHDAAAIAFQRASGDCKDASPALTLAANENFELCLARVLPSRHTLTWLHDAEREGAWASAIRAELTAQPGCAVLCTGDTFACNALHAALAVSAGAREAVAVCGCRLVAEAGARAAPAAVRLEPKLPLHAGLFRADVLCWDVGNSLTTSSLANLRLALAECRSSPAVLPRSVCVKCCVVECLALAELNSVSEVRISREDIIAAGGDAALAGSDDHVFSFAAFQAEYERSTRAVQLQAASMQPWRALTETVVLLQLDPAGELESNSLAQPGAWVSARAVSEGKGHAVLTWIEADLGGAVLSTAPPELATENCSAGPLSLLHCTQYATFAASPWSMQPGCVLQLRGMVTPGGIQVEALSPDFPCAGSSAGPKASSIPDYHASMLNDKRRNAAYYSGIRAAIQQHRQLHGESPRVLDIGAGAGLLSMMAAKAGAAEVVACERDAELAAAACSDIEANGLGESVMVVGAHSRALGDDNVGRFDLIISEIFGSDALSEGVLPTLAHAQAALLRPNAGIMIPGKLVIRAALACSGVLRPLESACGETPVDRLRNSFGSLAPRRCSVHLPDVPGAKLLTDVASYALDFNARPLLTCGTLQAEVVTTTAGDVDSVAYWFEVVFADGARVATGPGDGRRAHWMQTLFRLSPTTLRAGERRQLAMEFTADRTSFRLELAGAG